MPLRRSPSVELGEELMELKRRSGRSYEWIGRRTNLSKSAVHRLCAGQSVLPEFGTIEQVARTCGADPDDIGRLFALWRAAITEHEHSESQAAPGANAPRAAEPAAPPPPIAPVVAPTAFAVAAPPAPAQPPQRTTRA